MPRLLQPSPLRELSAPRPARTDNRRGAWAQVISDDEPEIQMDVKKMLVKYEVVREYHHQAGCDSCREPIMPDSIVWVEANAVWHQDRAGFPTKSSFGFS